jgi:methylated-DNA-[protein]-cysteine S-methyltransferase
MSDQQPDQQAIERSIEQALRRRGAGLSPDGAGPTSTASTAGTASRERDSLAAAEAAGRLNARIAAESLADVTYAPIESPFGTLLAASTAEGLVRLAFPEEDADAVLDGLARRISPRIVESSTPLDPVRRELDEYFDGRRRAFELALDWRLIGPFGQRVLKVTSDIPYGDVLTYSEVANDAGSPRGSRAAGNALGSNPIPIVIPCHRVLRTGGALGGYGGGLPRKRWLLELEGALG